MPAEELLALAERWRADPAGAAADGALLTSTRAGLASLDGQERAALGDELRHHGATALADRLEVSDRLPVWSEEFTDVARELLTVDDATLDDLRRAVRPDTLTHLDPDDHQPVPFPPPDATETPVWSEVPDTPEVSATPGVAEVAEVAEVDAPPEPTEAADTAIGAERPQMPGVPRWEARRWDPGAGASTPERAAPPAGPAALPTPGTQVAPRPGATDALAPGQRSTVDAHTRFARLAELTASGEADRTAVHAAIAEAPDGWQRRRVVLRLLDAGVRDLDADVVLGSLERPSDRITVADRLVRHGVCRLADVGVHLPAGAGARLSRRHDRG